MSANAGERTGRARAALLNVHLPSGAEMVVPLEGNDITVGKADKNSIVVDDAAVSSTHAIFRQSGSEWMVVDLGSRNGVYVNHHRISGSAVVGVGDVVQIGHCQLVLRAKPKKQAARDGAGSKSKKPNVARKATYIKLSGALLAKILGPIVTVLFGLLLSGTMMRSCGKAKTEPDEPAIHRATPLQ